MADVQFCLLEQHFPDGPEHPFAQTMMKHFSKLRTPLHSIHSYPSLCHQERRFIACGWKHAKARSLWDLWNDSEFLDDAQATSLDSVEAFDEWEEFALFAAHYFLLSASSCPSEQEGVYSQHTLPSDLNGTSNTGYTRLSLLPQCPPRFNNQRRFGATVPVTDEIVGLHGGSGRQTRLSSSDVYSTTAIEKPVRGIPPPTVSPRMCHSITPLANADCLLVGGRSSPTAVLGDCWLRRDMVWRQVESLPLPRFRHASTGTKISGEECVLVYGGKSSAGDIFADFLVWREFKGWQALKIDGSTPPPRFGACLASVGEGTGVLCGGIDKRGRVLLGFWTWTLTESEDGTWTISLENKTESIRGTMSLFRWLGRFGASVNVTTKHLVIVGGISADGVVPHEYDILLWPLDVLAGLYGGEHKICTTSAVVVAPPVRSARKRPLLVGHSSYTAAKDQKVLILGGGAVCFSFGTHWNEGTWLLQEEEEEEEEACVSGNDWLPVETHANAEQNPSPTAADAVDQATVSPAPLTTIPRVKISSSREFETVVGAARPVILEGLDIGPCSSLWTKEYLKDAVGRDRNVSMNRFRN